MKETERLYEAMVVVSCKSGGESVAPVVEKLKKLIENSAKLQSFNEWGKRKLAYPINKEAEAYYVLFTFVSESSFPAEFDRICRITDGILRSMVVKCNVKKKKPAKKPKKKEESVPKDKADGGVAESETAEKAGSEEVATSNESVSEEVKA